MQELRFVAVSEDGSYAVLAVPGRSGRYVLPIDERLRAVALGQTSRLAQYEIEVESPLRPKEIQARIRAGETAEEIADAAGIPVERVRWFEGPVLAERAYIADQAQSGSVRRAGDSAGPGPRLGDIVTERLAASGTNPAEGQWDSRKRGDGNWQVSLTFPSGGRLHVAEWVFDPRRRHVMPDDDNAARLSLPETELPAEPLPKPGEATVTQIAPRLGAAAGMGGGGVSAPGVSRFRPERSVIPDRSLGVDRSLVERPAARPDRAAGLQDRAPAPSPPVPPRPGQQDRPPHPDGPANPGYAEFPESAPYRAPAPAPPTAPPAHRDPPDYDDPASASGAFRSEPAAHRDDRDPALVTPAYHAPANHTPANHTGTEPSAGQAPDPKPRGYRDPVGFRAPAAEPPARGGQRTEPAAHPASADEVPAFDQPER
ncbi:MAG: septation protein SepH, partial [Trebonia sp.]